MNWVQWLSALLSGFALGFSLRGLLEVLFR